MSPCPLDIDLVAQIEVCMISVADAAQAARGAIFPFHLYLHLIFHSSSPSSSLLLFYPPLAPMEFYGCRGGRGVGAPSAPLDPPLHGLNEKNWFAPNIFSYNDNKPKTHVVFQNLDFHAKHCFH